MTATDTMFAGSIPGLYHRLLGPLLFEPYAEEVARRAAAFLPGHVLETAAGTGIVTAALNRALPEAHIIATDLNPAMLEVAAGQVRSDRVTFEPADAQDLRFADSTFDLVVCQFGVMFYPDKVRANAEARRVLRDGGRYLMLVWDSIERHPASKIATDAVARLWPDDPPNFFQRTPHGYSDPSVIERDLVAAGFDDIDIETVEARSKPISARDAAIGICQGTPLRNEIEQRDPGRLEEATRAAAEALKSLERDGRLDARLSTLVVTATK
ncbi:MAG: class I SAM-dependent methyltransferase [Sphingomicrobium sp.]